MPEQIRVALPGLRQAADAHRRTAEYLATIPLSHTAIEESLASLGPIYGGLARAGRRLLEERRRCYESQANEHTGMSDGLAATATAWEQHQTDAVAAFQHLTADGS